MSGTPTWEKLLLDIRRGEAKDEDLGTTLTARLFLMLAEPGPRARTMFAKLEAGVTKEERAACLREDHELEAEAKRRVLTMLRAGVAWLEGVETGAGVKK
jgi:hypothetical protein